MLIDYHMHTPLCGHANGEPAEYVEQGIRVGLSEIGFSEHNPMPKWADDNWRMRRNAMERYLEMIDEVQVRYDGRISVKLGLECDFRPGTEEFVRDTINQHRFDYIIGSVHYIGDWVFDSPETLAEWDKRDLFAVWREYFDLMTQAANTGMFDIMGHPDLVKKFGHVPREDCAPLFEQFLTAVKQNDLAMEISTAGLRKPVGEMYPSTPMIEMAKRMDVPIVISSDAHEPAEVGYEFPRAVELARSVGFAQIARYSGRKRQLVPLG